CRRAERLILRLSEEALVEEPVMRYINRLSDYFFVLARKEVWRTTGGEIIWDKSCD
ncbi:ATP:cob(I)alamin adenosyltransferase, partial [Porphyromonas loveana]